MSQIDGYDDTVRSTAEHIRAVGNRILDFTNLLNIRAVNHDRSKWSDEEWPAFRDSTPKLASLTYGSNEYKQALAEIKPALNHHYKVNRHHPEHFQNGVDDMNLMDLVEMICDWKAATERHTDGDILKSLKHNKERFKIDDQLYKILENTVRDLGYVRRV